MTSIAPSELAELANIDPSLIRVAHSGSIEASRDYVLLWMQRAQRADDNPALECAVRAADLLKLPVLTLFVLTEYLSANFHHLEFMLGGLRETAETIRSRGIAFCIRAGQPPDIVREFGARAALIVGDEGRTAPELAWRRELANCRDMPMIFFVETDAIVPPALACPKLAWSAAQLRGRISAFLPHFLDRPEVSIAPRRGAAALGARSDDSLFEAARRGEEAELAAHPLLGLQRIDLEPGQREGMRLFALFLEKKLQYYAERRNDPNSGVQSNMSPYLHFGQVSARSLARAALDFHRERAQAFIEELVVRRELAINFVAYCPNYMQYESAVPAWARETLAASTRADAYARAGLEAGQSDDPYWNAAQLEMMLTGKMHNYMRMYWGKRILSWFRDPREAYACAIELNDRYSLDGRDPNGYAGVAWCFGRHDRPWPRREAFGAVRSMTPEGLRRKFDADLYAERIRSVYNARKAEVS